ncbi:unnamed protein product [Cylicocyclus nassatus]|uniref:Uncharacterized protein n=1 Tax=Cylicocyclus nassatus TaxID=53992 RepID=A0AA36GKA2_CYLNA|nr:unnamed protein product [Cylicocyclus nassatus]
MASAEDVQKKLAQFQENVNKKALIDWVRITTQPTQEETRQTIRGLYKYTHGSPFSWPVPAGNQGGLLAIRARITYDFWKFFMQDGRKNLYEYNNTNGTDIKISREKTITLEDQERLGLYIRKMIKDEYRRNNKKCVEVTLKKSLLKIGDNQPVKPAIAAILLDIDIDPWSGLPLDQLLSEKEKESLQKGEIKRGSLVLPDIQLKKSVHTNQELSVEHSEEKENDEQDRPSTSKKRTSDHDEDEPVQKKRLVQ